MKRPLTVLACLLTTAALPGAARADVFGPIGLASQSAVPGAPHNQQADLANDPAISGDGRYVAFDGAYAGKKGVFRRDLATGEVQTVAEGDATLPSISEDGRYVSFTTTARLDEENDPNAAPDVYVRDMDDPDPAACRAGRDETTEPCAYTLASAVDGAATGLTYEYGENRAFEETHYGSVAAGRSAITANGKKVAFVTTARSDLLPAAPPALPQTPQTPALEVAVRDLGTETTELVSVEYDPQTGLPAIDERTGQDKPAPEATPGTGAVYPGHREQAFPRPSQGASISADGSAVAWMGQEVARQTPSLAGEREPFNDLYIEPLWRRIADGPSAVTRHVTGGADPISPACLASAETKLISPPTLADPCQGPFEAVGGEGDREAGIWTPNSSQSNYLPRLSADGSTIAFLSNAREIKTGEEFGKTLLASNDLYVADMAGGITLVQALRRLSEISSGNLSDTARIAPIVDFAVSPDGSQVAFTTQRTVFALGSPAYVSPAAASVGMDELFDVDLANDTLTRVTHGYQGEAEPSEHASGAGIAATSPSFSRDGDTLAFASEASNLAYGDGNGEDDAFTVSRAEFTAQPTPTYISPPPANPTIEPEWALGVTIRSRPNGTVLLEASLPGAGALQVSATSILTSHAASRTGRRAQRIARTVAAAHAGSSTGGLAQLTLRLAPAYLKLAATRSGLPATVHLTFTASGHQALHETIRVTFHIRSRTARHRRAAAKRSARSR